MPDLNNREGLLIWKFDFALSTLFEIETDAIEHLVPKGLTPMQSAPGMSLLHLTALNFPAGALGGLPEFQELIFGVLVSPDLSRGVPKFATIILSLGSTNREHLEHSANYYKLPVTDPFNSVVIQHEPHAVEFADGTGQILTMQNIHPEPVYADADLYFQAFVEDNGDLYVADLHMQSGLFEHQQQGDGGKLWPHPFFRGIDLENAEPTAYLQMASQPGIVGQQLYPRPEKFR
ncbi:hypothetical protein ACFL45_06850 [Candidatus Neomarinimicrobiota bacterium]